MSLLQEVKLHFVSSVSEAGDFLDWLHSDHHGPVAYDTETTGLSWTDPDSHVRLVQFGDRDTGWSIDLQRWRALVEKAIETSRHWVGHNFPFDINWSRHERLVLTGRKTCTMLMSQFIDPAGSHALKQLADRHVDKTSSAGQWALKKAMDTNKWTWATIPIDFQMYWAYGAMDTVLTRRLYDYYMSAFPEDFATEAWEIEESCMPVLTDMRWRGIAIDKDYARGKQTELEEYITATRGWATDEFGIKNVTSNLQLSKRLLDDGIELTEMTAGGAWKMDKEVLSRIDHPLAAAALNVRKSQKIVSTYLSHFSVIDVAHPDINQSGAHTGRMTVRKPPLQTLPRGALVRDCFVPREGKLLVSADFDQVEMRILAEFCRDANLIAAINTGDLHTATARLVYGDPTITKKDPRRQPAKNAGFAKVFRAGVDKFALTAGISYEEAQRFLQLYDETMPGVEQWCARVIWDLECAEDDAKYVTSPFGRKQWARDREYAIVNYLVQGTAAEVFKRQLVRLDWAGFGDMLLLPVHDEIIAEVPAENAEEIARELAATMTFNDWIVPLTASADVMTRWGDKYRDALDAPDLRDDDSEE